MNAKNIIISACAIVLIGLIFLFRSGSNTDMGNQQTAERPATATSTQTAKTATSTPAAQPQPKKPAASGLNIYPGIFHYDIVAGKTPCGDKIGSFVIESVIPGDKLYVIPGEKLYWELEGMKPLWMDLSTVAGETPARVDMTYNCILSGASSDTYQAAFDVMQTTKEGKPLHKYLFAVAIDGKISLESK